MTVNMTVCPECATEFETVAQQEDLPLQRLEQQCPDCGYDVVVGIINYPDGRYEVIAPSMPDVDTECVACGDPPTHRVQKIGCPVEALCIDHVGAHREAAFDLGDEQ